MVRKLMIASVALMVLALSAQAQEAAKAPNFKLKARNGTTVELKKLEGKVVVVNFWATWCGPCKAEIPGFLEVYKQYKSRGLEIVGVSLDRDGWKPVRPFVEKFSVTYPVVIGDGELADAYGGIQAIPTTFLIDRQGNIVKRHVGYLGKTDFESLIKPLL